MKNLNLTQGTKIYSTSHILSGEIERINNRTIDVRCEMWQTKNAIGNNILVRFDKAYLFQGEKGIEMYQKTAQDSEIWGKIL